MTAATAPSFLVARRASWRRLMPALLVAPLVIYMVVFYALPLTSMLLRSISDPTWTTENYRRLIGDVVFQRVLWTTLRTSFVVTIGALLLGYPVALAMTR